MMQTKASARPQVLPVAQPKLELDAQPSNSGFEGVGLQRNESLTEVEAMAVLAPEDAVAEELRLEKEREAEEAASTAAAKAKSTGKELSAERYKALNQLLAQSEQYAKFMQDQITEQENISLKKASQALPPDEESLPQEGKGKKGKRGRGARQADAAVEEGAEAKKCKSSLTPTQELLPLLKADLRDYQIKGVKWLVSLHQNGINGILADQMGLGKTVQTIGFLSHLKHMGLKNQKYMVVGPLSTLANWLNEFQRFLPSMPALLYHGTKQEREALRLKHQIGFTSKGKSEETFPVIITSYEIVIADIKFLNKVDWQYLVVDEGHRLKNFNCRLIKEMRTLKTENRLLLTGTPLQNNLTELWSLLNFLMPEVFGSITDFEAWFEFSSSVGSDRADQEIMAAEQRNQMVTKLHSILRPFMLRRLKSDVDISLPHKQEIILYSSVTDTQKALNQQLTDGSLAQAMESLAREEGMTSTSSTSVRNVLMQMRKICNHPDLITAPFTQNVNFPTPEEMEEQCGKMQLLARLLPKLKERGHKVLIFSQMSKVLDLLESYFSQQGHHTCRIDGSIKWQDRQADIKSFNEDKEKWLFLLTTRAGGLGINLTSADTVIIYDSDWNPTQDLQAMDRCHRIGQTRPVLVFRLATAHSVEGKMLKRAADKMVLEKLVIKKGAFLNAAKEKDAEDISLSATELMELLQGNYKMGDVAQSDVVSAEMLESLLDRTHLEQGKSAPYPATGVGYEVVEHLSSNSSGLQQINK